MSAKKNTDPGSQDAAQPATEPIKFSDAMQELEAILGKLDQDDVDLDDLAGMVERAAELIRLCRDRITRTEGQVQRIIRELDDEEGDDDPDAEDLPA